MEGRLYSRGKSPRTSRNFGALNRRDKTSRNWPQRLIGTLLQKARLILRIPTAKKQNHQHRLLRKNRPLQTRRLRLTNSWRINLRQISRPRMAPAKFSGRREKTRP